MDTVTYALCKKYVEKTAIGLGAVKGAPCKIKKIEESVDGKTVTVTFEWVSTVDPLVKETAQMTIRNGSISTVTPILESGVKIAEITVDGEVKSIYAPEGGGGSSVLTNEMTVTKAVGGVSAGKHYDAGVTLETIIRDMLSPVLYPTLTNPSATLSVPGTTLLEYGTVINKTFTCAFSQGSINPAYGTNGKRSGPAETYSLNGGTPQSGNTFTEEVSELNRTFKVNVTYAEGPQPKDSAGNNYSSPLPAGNVDSNIITYDFTYALWSNAADSTSIVRMDLVKQSDGQRVINFGACDEAHPEVFDIPTNWGLTAIKVKNDLTGNWDVCTEDFTSSSITHKDAADNDVNYTRYTCNLGYDMGPREIRVEWS